jgi:hypothetical protein
MKLRTGQGGLQKTLDNGSQFAQREDWKREKRIERI